MDGQESKIFGKLNRCSVQSSRSDFIKISMLKSDDNLEMSHDLKKWWILSNFEKKLAQKMLQLKAG